jgi:nucleolar protein 14
MNTFADDYAASDDEEIGEIDEATVNAVHFGGGFEPKIRKEGEDGEDGDERTKTKKEVMEELIAKSKYYRVSDTS